MVGTAGSKWHGARRASVHPRKDHLFLLRRCFYRIPFFMLGKIYIWCPHPSGCQGFLWPFKTTSSGTLHYLSQGDIRLHNFVTCLLVGTDHPSPIWRLSLHHFELGQNATGRFFLRTAPTTPVIRKLPFPAGGILRLYFWKISSDFFSSSPLLNIFFEVFSDLKEF